MRKTVAGLFISLDGVVESPQDWHFPYMNDEMGAAVGVQMVDSDTTLLGRRTYEEFAAYWAHQGSDVPFADEINGATKVVASRTLKTADWQNSTVLQGDLADGVRALKQQPGKDIAITGSPTLVRALLREGLLDELRLLVHPILVGRGRRLFSEDLERQPLTLISSATFSTGVLNLIYQPA